MTLYTPPDTWSETRGADTRSSHRKCCVERRQHSLPADRSRPLSQSPKGRRLTPTAAHGGKRPRSCDQKVAQRRGLFRHVAFQRIGTMLSGSPILARQAGFDRVSIEEEDIVADRA